MILRHSPVTNITLSTTTHEVPHGSDVRQGRLLKLVAHQRHVSWSRMRVSCCSVTNCKAVLRPGLRSADAIRGSGPGPRLVAVLLTPDTGLTRAHGWSPLVTAGQTSSRRTVDRRTRRQGSPRAPLIAILTMRCLECTSIASNVHPVPDAGQESPAIGEERRSAWETRMYSVTIPNLKVLLTTTAAATAVADLLSGLGSSLCPPQDFPSQDSGAAGQLLLKPRRAVIRCLSGCHSLLLLVNGLWRQHRLACARRTHVR